MQQADEDDSYRDLVGGDGVVGVDDEVLGRERGGLLELGGEEEAGGGEELELVLGDRHLGEEAVHVVDGEGEDLRLAALLLGDLEHPVGDDLAHVRLDLGLDGGEVVLLDGGGLVLGALEDVGEDAGVGGEDGVLVGAGDGQDDAAVLGGAVQEVHLGGDHLLGGEQQVGGHGDFVQVFFG